MKVDRAMVLAAGLGLRMRPLTATRPKPLIEVGGRTMLDWTLDHLVDGGVRHAVVNAHYLADQIVAHLADRRAPKIEVSREAQLLDTGGGVAKALPKLGSEPFFVLNADVVWRNGSHAALARMAEAWDDSGMDVLLLLHATVRAVGYEGVGDYTLDRMGAARRRREREVAPFVFTGVQLVHPRLFEGAPGGAFSMNVLFDRAEAVHRLYAIVHDGDWFHVGTPAALADVERLLAEPPGPADPRREP
jgi:MurNAc alpha-1-phosphate uridylyltransferase